MPPSPPRPAAAAPWPRRGWRRRLGAWWYGDLAPELRAEAEAFDRRLLAEHAGVLTLVIWFALAVVGAALRLIGLPALAALVVALLFVAGSALAMRRAWFEPDKFDPPRLRRIGFALMAGLYGGALAGNVGQLFGGEPREVFLRVVRTLWHATPVQLFTVFALLLLLWAVATGRRAQIQRALEQSRLEAERDAAARLAAEARLKLLQAQIQPHFLFNTLAALQHWVDTGDARAAPLLRALTSFLRGSTALMLRDEVTLADELPLARHYLGIMAARFGDRLHPAFEVDDDCLAQPLPPALVLTLLENAVEHGIAPLLRPGRVALRARRVDGRFELTVADDGAGLADGWREGVGLANSRLRLQHRFGTRARLQLEAAAPGASARVTIEDPA